MHRLETPTEGVPRATIAVVLSAAALVLAVFAGTSAGRDRPFSTSRLISMKLIPNDPNFFSLPGTSGGQFSKVQVEAFRCNSAANRRTRST